MSAALRAVMVADVPPGPGLASLGLDSLPARITRLSSGMIYSLACDQQAIRLPLAARALAASLATGKQCVLVTPGDPAMFLRKARLAGFDLAEHVRRGRLTLLQLGSEADKSMFRAGPEGFLRELGSHLVAPGAFLVFDQADAVFMLLDPRASIEAAQAYLQWVGAHDHTLLALFAPSAMAPREYLALRRAAENFAGFAVARSTWDGGTLDVRHWFAAEGASPRESFPLRLHSASAGHAAPNAAPDELPPVDTVIWVHGAMRAPLPGWQDWQEVASTAEALQAARRSESATLLFPFSRRSDFVELCRAVATLRAMARPELRVVVRECDVRLRAVQTLGLMRLGVSSIVPTGMSDLNAKRILDLLKGTRFARSYETDVQQVEYECSCFAASAVTGVPMFCEAVEGLLAVADGLDFESCMVRVAVQGAEAARLLGSARHAARDMIAVARGDAVWLFLFGCPEAALASVMQRIARSGVKWSAVSAPHRILLELEALRAA